MPADESKELNKNPKPGFKDNSEELVEAVTSENEEDADGQNKGGAKFKRRIFLIKRGLQFRYMGVIFTAMLLVAMIVGWTVYFSIWKDLSDPTKKHEELVEIFLHGNDVLMSRMTVIMVMICFLSVFVSHKIAGPVYRLEESAKIIASGDFSKRIKLRYGDELQDLADAFNTMTESLDKIVGEDQKMLQNLNTIIGRINEDFGQKTLTDKRKAEILSELKYIAAELGRISSTFVISENDKMEEKNEEREKA